MQEPPAAKPWTRSWKFQKLETLNGAFLLDAHCCCFVRVLALLEHRVLLNCGVSRHNCALPDTCALSICTPECGLADPLHSAVTGLKQTVAHHMLLRLTDTYCTNCDFSRPGA